MDAYRYYFLRDVAFGHDGSISMEAMVQRYNGDLANDWGNLCSRLFNMTEKYFEGLAPAAPDLENETDEDETMRAHRRARFPRRYEDHMRRLDYSAALESAWELIKYANRYIENAAPWTLAKEGDTARLAAVLYNALEAVRIAALFTAPVMPNTSAEVWRRLGLGDITQVTDVLAAAEWGGLPAGSPRHQGRGALPAHLRRGVGAPRAASGRMVETLPTLPDLGAPSVDAHAHLDMLDDPVAALVRAAQAGIALVATVVDLSESPETTLDGLGGWLASAGAAAGARGHSPRPRCA